MEWFKTWFASPYYHVLYKDRDDREAEFFIENLLKKLNPKKNSKFLDLACGAGRHSIFLNSKGYSTVGVDLSEPSIELAKKSEKENLDFYVHDMRNLFRTNHFNYIVNLFTSFGYFEEERDNIKMLNACYKGLTKNGALVIDFMNTTKVINNLVSDEIKVVDNITFNIERAFDGRFIRKRIRFQIQEKSFDFEEKVQQIEIEKMKYFLSAAGFKDLTFYGNYKMEAFKENDSDRLIVIAKK